ncbi:hypothetical protein M426DRAFT_174992 [Hypoxylon sp. CI-4A]|nr:hypothetical protein M426DRAFT_174992 [Hypoxylon sp. CI-4A]
MTNISSMPRTAPIAIAPKPSQLFSIRPHTHEASLNSMNSNDSTDSDSAVSGGGISCESCLRRRLKCIAGDEDESCISCQLNALPCSLSQSPQPRKRKLARDSTEESNGKFRG